MLAVNAMLFSAFNLITVNATINISQKNIKKIQILTLSPSLFALLSSQIIGLASGTTGEMHNNNRLNRKSGIPKQRM